MRLISRHLSPKIIICVAVIIVGLVALAALIFGHLKNNSPGSPATESSQPNQQALVAPTPQTTSQGWHITVYYTAVELYHHGSLVTVRGCLSRDCSNGNSVLGDYPSDFVEKVKNEGAGRITSGASAGRYLNWAYDTGYWLDTIPSDTNAHPLQAFASAAADSATLAQNSVFRLATCGSDPSAITKEVCAHLQSATWKVVDHFTPGIGGPRHIDLYVGEENQDNFEASDQVVDLTNVSLRFE